MPVGRDLVACLVILLIGLLCVTAAPARARASDLLQPWGLPPLPAEVGPV